MRFAILVVALAAMLFSSATYAQQLHAVLVGDTTDVRIGAGVEVNLDHLRSFFQDLRTAAGINVTIDEVKGDAKQPGGFNCTSILAVVSKLKASPNDVILFYYAGHGFRARPHDGPAAAETSQFPEFACRFNQNDPPIGMEGVVRRFQQRQRPRLLIAIADACNRRYAPTVVPKAVLPPLGGPDLKLALRRLFFQYKGTLLMSGSIPGEDSWYDDNLGGYFSNQLMTALYRKINQLGSRVSWEEITAEASVEMPIPYDPPTVQHPQIDARNLQDLEVVGGVGR
jgi:hypothetical protein